mmetsp:Transcript_32746/g.65178  ORF Transcript_32746/g.65178 Transcript_32746/m.65178 type:complete len:212 (+) Transcript_32746:4462-5097(+)
MPSSRSLRRRRALLVSGCGTLIGPSSRRVAAAQSSYIRSWAAFSVARARYRPCFLRRRSRRSPWAGHTNPRLLLLHPLLPLLPLLLSLPLLLLLLPMIPLPRPGSLHQRGGQWLLPGPLLTVCMHIKGLLLVMWRRCRTEQRMQRDQVPMTRPLMWSCSPSWPPSQRAPLPILAAGRAVRAGTAAMWLLIEGPIWVMQWTGAPPHALLHAH